MKRALLLAGLALLGGCSTYSLEKLRRAEPKGDAFQTELARLYMDFATEEEAQYDWPDSWYFADKGLALAYGHDQPPEDLATRDIPAAALSEMQEARAALMAVRTPEGMQAQPGLLAQSQFHFDCWVEQQEENWEEEEITRCQNGFALAMNELTEPARPLAGMPEEARAERPGKPVKPVVKRKPPVKKAVTAPAKAARVAVPPAPPVGDASSSYVLFFPPGSAALTAQAKTTIDEVVASLEDVRDYAIVLRGQPGAKETLARQRLDVVRTRLEGGGISPSRINPPAASGQRIEIYING